MVELRDRRILIDGKPTLILAGEIHYFRLRREEWEDRILKTKALGCNAIATYIPWVVHEPRLGEIDVTGVRRPENDLGAFIDLCASHGLWFIARPGPFVMAEMKNEGLPFWVYDKVAPPKSWEGKPVSSRTLDYGDPELLRYADLWYAAVIPVLAERLQTKGGPVIAIQLDNEVGMLSWVNNEPDLSDRTVAEFAGWLSARYGDAVAHRYPFLAEDPDRLRTPDESFATALHRDYGDFERDYFRDYLTFLRRSAEKHGATGMPFIVNIHGTGWAKGATFPIGISQLLKTYTEEPGYVSGSDHYLGELTRDNVPDLYFINAFMEAVHRPEQPLTSVEFEVGTGDYGESGGMRQSGVSAELKARLSVAQGNRLLNYYLLAGGVNPPLEDPVGDGNDRVAFTGERHGFAAPISPEGFLDPNYHALARTTHALMAVKDRLADLDPELDGVALGFIPDYYKTDYSRPGKMKELVGLLEAPREPLAFITRVLLFEGYRFTALDIQNRPLEVAMTPALVLAASVLMDASIQQKLADYVKAGGRLLLVGDFPTRDMEGAECLILSEALGIRRTGTVHASSKYHLSAIGQDVVVGEPEVRIGYGTTLEAPSATPLLRVKDTDEVVALRAEVGAGRVAAILCNYALHGSFFRRVFESLGMAPGLAHDDALGGIVLASGKTPDGERFLTVMNIDHHERSIRVQENGQPLFGGNPIHLGPREANLLPMNLALGDGVTLAFSTSEITDIEGGRVRFRPEAGPTHVEWRESGEVRRAELTGAGPRELQLT